jgi:hypothetical protein
MDFAGLAMEGLLAVLLVAALMYGRRLEQRLKALRESQATFAQAIRTLDSAAARAETGLETLRKATEEAQDGLQDRIVRARELKAELEKLIAKAEASATSLASAKPASLPARAAARTVEEPLVLTVKAEPRPLSFRPTERRPLAHNLDEDLFETADPAPRKRAFGVR